MVTRIVVGAGYGLGDWIIQRVSAAYMVVYTVVMGLILLFGPELNQQSWHELMSAQFMRSITLLFIIALAYHAWIGVRDIWMDYIKPDGLRFALHIATALLLIAYAGWAVQILWRL